MDKRDLENLVDGYCSGSLSEEEFAQLEEALRHDPQLRRDLLESRMLESELRQFAWSLDQQDLQQQQPSSKATAAKFSVVKAGVWAAAAVLVALFVSKSLLPKNDDGTRDVAVEPTPGEPGRSTAERKVALNLGVAVLARDHGARWANASPRPGDSMPPGRWNLESGTAEIQFYSGASVTLQAPAELEILSEDGGILHFGNLHADVPKRAHGFSIKTETIELVDLGTSFGMSVGEDSSTEVHVFEGEVELFDRGGAGDGKLLTAGQGRVFKTAGEGAPMPIDPSRFAGSSQLDEKLREEYPEWQRMSAMWNRDPSLLARYDFERIEGSRRILGASSSLLDKDLLEGVIIDAEWGRGRWREKAALDFKRPSAQVRVNVPGQYNALTMVASLRVDGLDNYYNSILLSDGWDRQGAFHWQILRNKTIELSVSGGAGQAPGLKSQAPLVLEPSDLGRWMQLAVSYDAARGVVSHYQNGVRIGETSMVAMVPVEIGPAEIGNWSPPDDQAREIRNFNGRFDEILIFNEVLGAEEISRFCTGSQIRSVQPRPIEGIVKMDAPAQVSPGRTASLAVDYNVTKECRIELNFTLDAAPWTNFGSVSTEVEAGSGSVMIDVPIDAATPEAQGAYKLEASVIPVGGSFEDRIDSLSRQGMDCVK